MNLSNKNFASFAVIVLASGYVISQDKKLEIVVDGTTMKVPLPGDLVPSKAKLKSMSKFMESKTPTNQIHEIFAAKGTTEEKYLQEGLRRNADVQTVRSLDNKMTQSIFDGVKGVLTKQFDQMMKQALDSLSDDATGISFKTKQKVGSGAFINKKDQYAYLFYSQIKQRDGKVTERVSATSICFIKDNMIMFNVHADLLGEKDAKWVKETAANWLKAALKMNQVEDF